MRLLVLFLLAAAATADVSEQLLPEMLCAKHAPDDALRNSLLMCRELSYVYCMNTSLLGSMVTLRSSFTKHLVATVREQSRENIDRLAQLADAEMVLLYEAYTAAEQQKNSTTLQHTNSLACVHDWRMWICSRVFSRRDGEKALSDCPHLCQKVHESCGSVPQQCADFAAAETKCTDFTKDNSNSKRCASPAAAATAGKKPKKNHHHRRQNADGTTATTTVPVSSASATAAWSIALLLAFVPFILVFN